MSIELDIPGLYFSPEVITAEEERVILNFIKKDRGHFVSQIHPAYEFGWKFIEREKGLHGISPLTPKEYLGQFPSWLSNVWFNCIYRTNLPKEVNRDHHPDHVLVNEYKVGEGCMAHTDDIGFWTDWVMGLSLESGCTIIFKRGNTTYPVYLPPRSIYVLTGDARYKYTHEIAPEHDDIVNDEVIPRRHRTSLTFRMIHQNFLSNKVRDKVNKVKILKN